MCALHLLGEMFTCIDILCKNIVHGVKGEEIIYYLPMKPKYPGLSFVFPSSIFQFMWISFWQK